MRRNRRHAMGRRFDPPVAPTEPRQANPVNAAADRPRLAAPAILRAAPFFLPLRETAMTTVEVTLNLPDQLAQEAQRAGLLSAEAISRLIEEAVRREAGKRLVDAMARLREASVPPLTEEEIAEEVAAVPAARRAARAAGR